MAFDPSMCPKGGSEGNLPGGPPGTVDTCSPTKSCPQEKGPQECINGFCFCMTGYCTHMPQPGGQYCVSRVLGKMCKRNTDCTEHGSGLVFCADAACMCVWNHRYDPSTNKCEKGWLPPIMPTYPPMMPTMPAPPMGLAELTIPGNHSQVVEFEDQEPAAGSFNVGMVWASAAAAIAMVVSGVTLARSKSNGLVQENNEYQQLQNDEAIPASCQYPPSAKLK